MSDFIVCVWRKDTDGFLVRPSYVYGFVTSNDHTFISCSNLNVT